ncbi:protein-glutamine glutaminase [Capnocytophaga catalasegens]|uniref:Protein glutaminase domain-containing protein n=1 Tax=Capnocytophaga catalasegens TaxID=1004260 RepID=A0AAV5ATT2_9FLAO|nr:protein-glutamine glutaminase [Capnocytophaga catalasegens]GIZ14586.1 hypothetical protein RCZ03_05870 [Capnocytophaga catalasegens]GJM50788.1 hypothetical protein RCZ15_17610 [Capnocytophaga catalasegens]GJM51941.1 hypothetical protein RCZ16_02590 [Capnocytophaga catalasegens]
MKNLLLVNVLIFILFFNSCSNKDKDSLILGPPRTEMKIPVGLIEEGTNMKVSFMLSHQFYTIEMNKETQSFITLIKEAIEKEKLLIFYLKAKSNEIIAVQQATEQDTKRFDALFKTKPLETKPLEKVIPDLKTLTDLFSKIKTEACSFEKRFPCITFNYPVDGCYARAHKMRQILANNGYDCEKQFLYGVLNARYDGTEPDKGGCCVSWSYHVSILVSYKDESGQVQKRIIDPSVFGQSPLLEEDWRKMCLNDSCGKSNLSSYTNTTSDVYYRSPKGTFLYDNDYKNTNCVLEIYSQTSGCSLPAPSIASCGF